MHVFNFSICVFLNYVMLVSMLYGRNYHSIYICIYLTDTCMYTYTTYVYSEPTNHLDAESVAWLEKYLQVIYILT